MWEYEYSVETAAAPDADFPDVLAALVRVAENWRRGGTILPPAPGGDR